MRDQKESRRGDKTEGEGGREGRGEGKGVYTDLDCAAHPVESGTQIGDGGRGKCLN